MQLRTASALYGVESTARTVPFGRRVIVARAAWFASRHVPSHDSASSPAGVQRTSAAVS